MKKVSQPKKKFADSWALALVLSMLTGAVLAYRRSDYALLAMGALFLLMALEPIVKKEISLRGKIVKKEKIQKYIFQ